MAQPLDAVQGARNRIVNAALLAVLVFGFVGFVVSILRARYTGWLPVMAFHIVFWIVIAVVAVFRDRIPFQLRGWLLIGLFFVLCATGLLTFGLIGMGIPGLLLTIVFTTLLFGYRIGWVVTSVCLATFLAVGVAVIVGWVSFEFDVNIYATAPASWVMGFVAILMFVFIVVTGISWTYDALEQSQAELIKAQEIARIGSWIWHDGDPQTVKFSAEGLRILGFPADQPLITMDEFNRHIHVDDRERAVGVYDATHKEPSDFQIEYRFVRPDDTVRHVVEISNLVLDDFGKMVGHAGTIQDVTEQKQAEEQLRQAQKMEVVGQLTAGVAHDFNNMLGIIWGNAELLEGEIGKGNPRLDAMVGAIKRCADLTQRLLAFSSKQVLSPEIVNANDLIANVTGLLRRTLEADIEVETITDPGLWTCELDPGQLENVLVNLAINARDAMPNGGKLTIETANALFDDDYAAAQADLRPGRYVMLAITDNGCGMSQKVQEQAFEPFFTTKAVGEGSGLGLSMVYGFVKQSGGNVTIYSEPGEGTTIKLYLPRSTETEVAERKPVTDEVPVARGEAVMVVEDEPSLRELTVTLLDSLGYQVKQAATGAEALEQLQLTPQIDLLLSDVVLAGGMNGQEVAVEAKRCVPGIRVLFMSGYTETATILHGRLDAGGAFLQKPFRKADLARAVRTVLDGPSASGTGNLNDG